MLERWSRYASLGGTLDLCPQSFFWHCDPIRASLLKFCCVVGAWSWWLCKFTPVIVLFSTRRGLEGVWVFNHGGLCTRWHQRPRREGEISGSPCLQPHSWELPTMVQRQRCTSISAGERLNVSLSKRNVRSGSQNTGSASCAASSSQVHGLCANPSKTETRLDISKPSQDFSSGQCGFLFWDGSHHRCFVLVLSFIPYQIWPLQDMAHTTPRSASENAWDSLIFIASSRSWFEHEFCFPYRVKNAAVTTQYPFTTLVGRTCMCWSIGCTMPEWREWRQTCLGQKYWTPADQLEELKLCSPGVNVFGTSALSVSKRPCLHHVPQTSDLQQNEVPKLVGDTLIQENNWFSMANFLWCVFSQPWLRPLWNKCKIVSMF